MSCRITSASYPVGPPYKGGSPNEWNVGGGNFLSLNKTGGLSLPETTRGGKKRKTRKHKKHKKSKRRNIKHKKKTHRRKHKKKHKKTNKRKRVNKKHKKHKRRTKRRKMYGGARNPLMPQSLVNAYRSVESGFKNTIDGWNGSSHDLSPLPTADQFYGQNKQPIIMAPVNVRKIYNAAAASAASV